MHSAAAYLSNRPTLIATRAPILPIAAERGARSRSSLLAPRRMSSSRHTCPICPGQQDNKYVRMCGGGVADAQRNADRSRQHVSQQQSNFEQDSTLEGRFARAGGWRRSSHITITEMQNAPVVARKWSKSVIEGTGRTPTPRLTRANNKLHL